MHINCFRTLKLIIIYFSNFQLFVLGGFSGKEMNDIFAYDIENKSWRQIIPGSKKCDKNKCLFLRSLVSE
jgi:hypothetical protein